MLLREPSDQSVRHEQQLPFTWASLVVRPELEPIATAFALALVLVGFAVVVRWKLSDVAAAVEPEDGITWRNVAEVLVEVVRDTIRPVLGRRWERYLPLLATFFVFIVASNLVGLIPGVVPATSSFNVTFALGVVSFGAYNYVGLREHGAGYVKHFLGPMLFVAPLMLVIETFSAVFRPISLGIRLYANMFADHTMIEKFTELVPLVVPVPVYFFGTLVAVVQAFVFTILSAIYIAAAVEHPESTPKRTGLSSRDLARTRTTKSGRRRP